MKIETNSVSQNPKQDIHAHVQVSFFLPTTTLKNVKLHFDIHVCEFRVSVVMKQNLKIYKNYYIP